MDSISEIKDKLDLDEVLQSSQLALKRVKAGEWKGRCPFHSDRSPSFFVSEVKKVYYCFGCGAKGSLVDLYAYLRNMSFVDAIQDLSMKYGIPLREEDERKEELLRIIGRLYEATVTKVKKSDLFKIFLEARRIPYELAAEARLGYWPIGDWWRKYNDFSITNLKELGLATYSKPLLEMRMIFPIKNWQGEVISLAGREIQSLVKVENKYINGSDSILYNKSRTFYGTPIGKSAKEKVVITEGYFDQMALKDLGYNALAVCGTAFTPYHASYLRHREGLVFLFDNDMAGSRARTEATKIAFQAGIPVKWGYIYKGKDALDCYIANRDELRRGVENAIDPFDYLIAILNRKNVSIDLKKSVWEAARDMASHLSDPFEVAKVMGKINEVTQIPNLPRYTPYRQSPERRPPLFGNSLSQIEKALLYHAISEGEFIVPDKWAITDPEYQQVYGQLLSGADSLDIYASDHVKEIFANPDLAGVSLDEIILNMAKTWFDHASHKLGYEENSALLDRTEELINEAEDTLLSSDEMPPKLRAELVDYALKLWQKYLGISFAKDEIDHLPFETERDVELFIKMAKEGSHLTATTVDEVEKIEALAFASVASSSSSSDIFYFDLFEKLLALSSPLAVAVAKKVRSNDYRNKIASMMKDKMVDLYS